MSETFRTLLVYLNYPFVRYALIAGVLISLSSSLLGVTLVLRRFSFIGDGLSHVAFGVMAVAAAANLANNILLVLPVTIVCAVLLLNPRKDAKVRGDAAIAMISVGMLAVGYLIMNISSSSSNLAGDVCTTLFGSTKIMTLTELEVWLSVGLSILVVVVFLVFYNKIFAVTFDEDFAAATGVNTKAYNLMISVITAVVIVLAMNLAGALLISGLIVFPALASMKVYRSFKKVTVCAVVFSTVCTLLGILISIAAGTPVGSTIVVLNIIGYFLFSIPGYIKKKG